MCPEVIQKLPKSYPEVIKVTKKDTKLSKSCKSYPTKLSESYPKVQLGSHEIGTFSMVFVFPG